MHHTSTRFLLASSAASLLLLLPACSITPVYTVRVDNQTDRTINATLERRPTINEVIRLDSAWVKGESSALLGPAEAPPLQRVYVVIGDRSDLNAFPESVELSRGEWVVTITPASITAWGTYQLEVHKADGELVDEARNGGERPEP